jgi:hypothetical protein
MLTRLRNIFKSEKGSAAVIIALTMTVFVGFSATVIDAGLLYVTKSKLSNAMDAAALAGVQELPYHPQAAINVAKAYAQANGIDESKLNIEIINNNTGIRVTTNRDIEFFFAKVLGHNSGRVEGSATARVLPISGLNGAVPLGIEDIAFEFGQTYTLKVGAGESEQGWFGALALEKPGASQYEENLKFGFKGQIKIGDILDIQTGNISNPTKRAIDYRILHCSHNCTVNDFNRNCMRLLKVPVIIPAGHKKVQVVGFSMFLVDQVLGQGNQSFITGTFIRTVTTGDMDEDTPYFGLYGAKLTN